MALVLVPLGNASGSEGRRAIGELFAIASFAPRTVRAGAAGGGDQEIRPEPLLLVPFLADASWTEALTAAPAGAVYGDRAAPFEARLAAALQHGLGRRRGEGDAVVTLVPALVLPKEGADRRRALDELDAVWAALDGWLAMLASEGTGGLELGVLRLAPWVFAESADDVSTAPELFGEGHQRRATPVIEGVRDEAWRQRAFALHGAASLVSTVSLLHVASSSRAATSRILGQAGTGRRTVDMACALLDVPLYEIVMRSQISSVLGGPAGVPDLGRTLDRDRERAIRQSVATEVNEHRLGIDAVFDAPPLEDESELRSFRGRAGSWLEPGVSVGDPRDPGAAHLVLPVHARDWVGQLAEDVETRGPRVFDRLTEEAVKQTHDALQAVAAVAERNIALRSDADANTVDARTSIERTMAILGELEQSIERRRPQADALRRLGVPDAAATARGLRSSWGEREGEALGRVAQVPTRLARSLEAFSVVLGLAAAAWIGLIAAGVTAVGTMAAVVGGASVLGILVGLLHARAQGAKSVQWQSDFDRRVTKPGETDARERVGDVLVAGATAVVQEVRFGVAEDLKRDVQHARTRLVTEVGGLRHVLQQEHDRLDVLLHWRRRGTRPALDEELGRFRVEVDGEVVGRLDPPSLAPWLQRLDGCVTLTELPDRISRQEHRQVVAALAASAQATAGQLQGLADRVREAAEKAARWGGDDKRLRRSGTAERTTGFAVIGALVEASCAGLALEDVQRLGSAVPPSCMWVARVRHMEQPAEVPAS